MNSRTTQKSTLLAILLIPWMLLWSILNRWFIPVQPNTKLQTIARKHNKAKCKKPNKTSTHKVVHQTLPVLQELQPVKITIPEPEIPLLTFSILPEPRQIEQPAVNKTARPPIEMPQPTREVLSQFKRIQQNITLCQIITNTHKTLLTESPFRQKTSLTDFISRLAFAYRFHRMLLAFTLLSSKDYKKTDTSLHEDPNTLSMRENFYQARNLYVHHILFHLSDAQLIKSLKEVLSDMRFDILDTLNATNITLNLFSHFTCLHNSVLYQDFLAEDSPMPNEYITDKTKVKAWLTDYIIPVSNTIHSMIKGAPYPIKQECYDALKMLFMIGGEFCPSNGKHVRKDSNIQDFLQTCRIARNRFSHHVFTLKLEHIADTVVQKGMKVSKATLKPNDDFYRGLIPEIPANNVLARKKSR